VPSSHPPAISRSTPSPGAGRAYHVAGGQPGAPNSLPNNGATLPISNSGGVVGGNRTAASQSSLSGLTQVRDPAAFASPLPSPTRATVLESPPPSLRVGPGPASASLTSAAGSSVLGGSPASTPSSWGRGRGRGRGRGKTPSKRGARGGAGGRGSSASKSSTASESGAGIVTAMGSGVQSMSNSSALATIWQKRACWPGLAAW